MNTVNDFTPAWWLPNGHLQTIWGAFVKRQIDIVTRRERIELEDGDFLDLDWAGPENGPIVLVLHGLGGSIDSHYSKGLLKAITEQGWRGLFMHFRGCSGEPNRLPRVYHCGEIEDVHAVINLVKHREPNTPLAVVGFSLGGNVIIRWLAERGHGNQLSAAAVVSPPFDLKKSAEHLNKGFSRVYQWYLLRDVRLSLKRKFEIIDCPIDENDIFQARSFWQFDEKVTAPLHGFTGADEYHQVASSRQYLNKIRTPMLVLHALDDPLTTEDSIPHPQELSSSITLELSQFGGHVGFVGGTHPLQAEYWLEKRIANYLRHYL